MSETQAYKIPKDFIVPAECVGVCRELFSRRLNNLNDVIKDEEARRVFTRAEISDMAVEAIMLAKMLAKLAREVTNA